MAAVVTVLWIRGKQSSRRLSTTVSSIIRPQAYVNTQTFYAPSLVVHNVIGPALHTNTQTFFDIIVASGQFVSPPLHTNSQTFYAPTISQNITAPLHTNTPTFYSPFIVIENASIALPLHTNTQAFYAPTLSLNLRPSLHTNTPLFFAPTVSLQGAPGFTLSTPGVVVTSAAGEPPAIDLTINTDHYAGYYLDIQRSTTGTKNTTDGSYVNPTLDMNHQITPSEIAALAITNTDLAPDGYFDPPSGTYYQQYRIRREDGALSQWVEISGTVTAATTVLHTINGPDKKSSCSVTGTPALTATGSSSAGSAQCVRATNPATGQKVFEVTVTALPSNSIIIGLDNGATDLNSGYPAPGITNTAGVGLRMSATGYSLWKAGTATASGSTNAAVNDVITVKFDTSAGSITYYRTRSGSTVTIGTITGASLTEWNAYIGTYTNASLTANFGQSAFARALDSGYTAY